MIIISSANMQKTVRKTISFPVGLVEDLEIIAFQYHMDFPDLMRYLSIQELQKARANEQAKIHTFSDETSKAVIEGRREYAEGKTKGFTDIKKLMKYLTSDK